MKKVKILFSVLALTSISSYSFSQCPVGQDSVTMVVHTDDYGYEGYWQIVPSGNACGVGVIAEGGNLTVGCNGAGLQVQDPGGYGNNLTIDEGYWCLTSGAQYDLIFVDDWGDGGFGFDIVVNGYQIESFDGMALGGTFTFTVEEPPAFDLSVFGSNLYSYAAIGSYNLSVHIFNGGTTTMTSYDLNYTIDGGPIYTHNVIGTSLINFETEDVLHDFPINFSTNGVYNVKVWADNLNGGNADLNNLNDTLSHYVEVGPGIPNNIDTYVGTPHVVNQIAGSSDQVSGPMDLDFHPVLTNKELWVINRGTEASGGSTVTIYDAGEVAQTSLYKQDGNAWHFMSLPTGLAFSQNGNWANSPGVYDANHNGGAAFTGPSLWSSDMAIYAEPSGGNGSHLDMLHLSPLSQGIASEKDNVYWIFDGNSDDIVRYDFAEDHGPGNSFHGDAIVRRFSDDVVTKDPADIIVSHLVLDNNQQWLYVVDHGGQRVIRIDINTGSDLGGAPAYPMNEPVVEYSRYEGYTQETVVTGLSKPAGIDVIDDRMIVSEYETGEIIIYDISVMPAVELDRKPTGLSSVQGIKIGPEGRIWFVDENSNGVYLMETSSAGLDEQSIKFSIYPNPSNGALNIFTNIAIDADVELRNIQGQLVSSSRINGQGLSMNVDAAPGVYFLSVITNGNVITTEQVVIK